MTFIRKILRDSKGATAIEYGLLAALISIAALTAIGNIGTRLNTKFTSVSNALQ